MLLVDDFIKSRQAIADFALANKIEAALILNAPKLNDAGIIGNGYGFNHH